MVSRMSVAFREGPLCGLFSVADGTMMSCKNRKPSILDQFDQKTVEEGPDQEITSINPDPELKYDDVNCSPNFPCDCGVDRISFKYPLLVASISIFFFPSTSQHQTKLTSKPKTKIHYLHNGDHQVSEA